MVLSSVVEPNLHEHEGLVTIQLEVCIGGVIISLAHNQHFSIQASEDMPNRDIVHSLLCQVHFVYK